MRISFISAGAGSGKTTRLVDEIFWRLNGTEGRPRARPHAIVATTYTRKAAADLRQKIARRLHGKKQSDLAEQLSQAMIGTVNSLGGHLLQRFAFEAGLSPELKVLDEDDFGLLLDEAVGLTCSGADLECIQNLARRLRQGDYNSNDPWKKQVGGIIGKCLANRIDASALESMAESSAASLLAHFPEPSDESLDAALRNTIGKVFDNMQGSSDTTKTTANALDFLRDCLRKLAEKRMEWGEWCKLAKLEPGKKSEAHFAPLTPFSERVGGHPKLRADIRAYIEWLFRISATAMDRFAELKKQRGVVDFADQERLALDLLDQPAVAATLQEELDLVLVDEFQDTSPIQLALFLKLASLAKESVWVGDVKQCIYAFRNSDPELMTAVLHDLEQQGNLADPLDQSWRSVEPLVRLVNTLFLGPFQKSLGFSPAQAAKFIPLKPARKDPPATSPLRFLLLEHHQKNKNGTFKKLFNDDYARGVAQGVAQLLDKPILIHDPAGAAQPRAVEPKDIAILCRKNDKAALIAGVLRAMSHPVSLPEDGLLSTPEACYALACLRRLADSRDTLATAEILALEADMKPDEWLADRLTFLAKSAATSERWGLDEPLRHSVIMALEAARAEYKASSPTEALDLALRAGNALRLIRSWGPTDDRGLQRVDNIEALRALAADYERRSQSLASPATVVGFCSSLEKLKQDEADSKAYDTGGNAIHVLTYHKAKGLEWPVVICTDLEGTARDRIWGLHVERHHGSPPFQMQCPLADRQLRQWINPFGAKTTHPILDHILDSAEGQMSKAAAEAEDLRLLYVAFTRARDVLVMVREHGSLNDPSWLDLLQAPWLTPPLDNTLRLPNGKTIACSTTHLVVQPPQNSDAKDRTFPWFTRADGPVSHPRARLTASHAQSLDNAAIGEITELGGRLKQRGDPEDAVVGDALHAIMAAAFIQPKRDALPATVTRLLKGYGLDTVMQTDEIVTGVDGFRKWIGNKFATKRTLVEWPFHHTTATGQRVDGWMDLLLETGAGWVIVDHKTFPGAKTEWKAKALEYSGQLAIYRDALVAATGQKIASIWIHFIVGGGAVELRIPGQTILR